MKPTVTCDSDADGRIVGMEVLEAKKHLSPEILDRAA
ncbi:DUF2283 domain-containing protein [Devosia sp. RR2S18]|nr:DUF2283 domain-containing protein [Devosia sp. RR2S18]WIJ25352.1 DUF2283 domain-containing protein [Devosia sp. RR2S18]